MKNRDIIFKAFFNEEWGQYTNYHHRTVLIHSMSGSGPFARLQRRDILRWNDGTLRPLSLSGQNTSAEDKSSEDQPLGPQ